MKQTPWQCKECDESKSCEAIVKNCKFYQFGTCASCNNLTSCRVYELTCIILIGITGVIFEQASGIH